MKPRSRVLIAPRKRKLVLWIAGLVLCYAIIGFFILPPIVRSVAVKQLSSQLDRDVSIEKVKINPFALSATIQGLLIKDKDGEPFIAWDELYVNLQISSFFGHEWVFKEIRASHPFIRAQMNKDYTFNFSDLIAKFATNAAARGSAEPASPMELRVGRLRLAGAAAALSDCTPREPFKRLIGPLDINLDEFRTDPGSTNRYSFTGTTDAGETISWSGHFSLDPPRSEGRLKLFHFSLGKYAPLYQDLVRFQVRDGSIAVDMKYRLEFSPTNRVTAVDDLAFSLRDLKLGVAGDTNNLVEMPLFCVLGGSADLENRVAMLDSMYLDGASISLKRNTNAAINVVELSQPAESATNAPGGILFLLRSVTNAVAMLLNSTNEWTASVSDITITNCAAHLEDLANPRPVRLDLSEMTLHAKNLSNLPGTNLEAEFSMRWNTNASVHLAANVCFQPTAADINLDLDRLDLTTLDAYLASKLNLFILGSEVNLHGVVRLRPQVNDLPVVSFNGDASLEHFHTVDGVFGQDLVKWDAVRFNGMSANLNPPLLALHEVVVENASARVIVETNHTINLLNLLQPSGAAATAASDESPAGGAPSQGIAASATNVPMRISIGTIVITNTSVNFSDRSLEPNVNLALESVQGSISDLSTEQFQHAIVNLEAKVDGAGPVTITGTINPLNGALTNALKISVHDVDLTPAGPYSGKFAGYDIAEGKLNLELDYKMIGKVLSAKNVITLDRFSLGQKVDSPDATHLPVRLAIAILKDRDGKIVLDVPIDGSLDDPKFRIGKVVTRAIVNILEKVAESPFSLLGAAIGGGGEELGWQEFAPGSAQLTPADTQKLDTLAKALHARPALSLEIAGSIDPEGDREGLQRAALDREMRLLKWKKLRKADQAATSADQIMLTPAERAHYIDKLYAEATAARKITPAFIAANPSLAPYVAEARSRAPSVQKGAALLAARKPTAAKALAAVHAPTTKLVPPPSPLEALLMATIPVSDQDFQSLAAARAHAAQTYLLQTGKVEASRIFLTATGPELLRHDGSRAYLECR